MTKYRLSIHPDDAQTWMDMTGRDESAAVHLNPSRRPVTR